MGAVILVAGRAEPVKVELIREEVAEPVILDTGVELIYLTADAARELGGALSTAAQLAPARVLRRPKSVDEAIAHADI